VIAVIIPHLISRLDNNSNGVQCKFSVKNVTWILMKKEKTTEFKIRTIWF